MNKYMYIYIYIHAQYVRQTYGNVYIYTVCILIWVCRSGPNIPGETYRHPPPTGNPRTSLGQTLRSEIAGGKWEKLQDFRCFFRCFMGKNDGNNMKQLSILNRFLN